MWWKFWEWGKKDKQRPKLSGMALRMFNQEHLTCFTCGNEYTANYTRCIRCGAPTVMNLEAKDEVEDARR